MNAPIPRQRNRRLSALLAITLGAALLFPGCGGKDDEPQATPPQDAKPTAQPDPNRPVTLDVLQYLPDETVFAMALPSLTSLQDKAVALAKRLAPSPETVDQAVNAWIANIAAHAQVPQAQTLADVAKEMGLRADAPMAFFVDPRSSVKEMKQLRANIGAVAEGLEASPSPGAEDQTDIDPVQNITADFDALSKIHFVWAAGVQDQAKAEAFIRTTAEQHFQLAEGDWTETAIGEVTLKSKGDAFGYFFWKEHLVSGTATMLASAAKHAAAPAAIPYGADKYPAKTREDSVFLVYLDRYLVLYKDFTEAMAATGEDLKAILDQQTALFDAMLETDGNPNPDPVVTTLAWTDTEIDLETRMDASPYPRYFEQIGRAKPLRLAQLLPEDTQALLSIQITNEQKKMMTESYLPMATTQFQAGPVEAMALPMIKQAVDMIGSEITLAAGTIGPDAQNLYGMVQLAKPDEAKGMLSLFLMQDAQSGQQSDGIIDLSGRWPLPFTAGPFLAIEEDVLLLSNDKEGMKQIIARIKEKKTTNLFANFDPPLDPATPPLRRPPGKQQTPRRHRPDPLLRPNGRPRCRRPLATRHRRYQGPAHPQRDGRRLGRLPSPRQPSSSELTFRRCAAAKHTHAPEGGPQSSPLIVINPKSAVLPIVIPAKAGIQRPAAANCVTCRDSRLRGNDGAGWVVNGYPKTLSI